LVNFLTWAEHCLSQLLPIIPSLGKPLFNKLVLP
jgi:hypothetical protein